MLKKVLEKDLVVELLLMWYPSEIPIMPAAVHVTRSDEKDDDIKTIYKESPY